MTGLAVTVLSGLSVTTPAVLVATISGALLLDAVIGDPAWRWHPVRLIGSLAAKAEALARARPGQASATGVVSAPGLIGSVGNGGTPDSGSAAAAPDASTADAANPVTRSAAWPERVAGLAVWVAVALASVISAITVSSLARRVHPWAGIAVDVLLVWASIAPTDLARHARRVSRALTLDAAAGERDGDRGPVHGRQAVSMIVGRDVSGLDVAGVARACVESVAESSIDGVAAPLFWAAVAGAPGAIAYRAINTMDSMFGHKNDTYLHFGLVAARADDIATWIPARMSSALACLVAPLAGGSARGAWSSFVRWRLAHDSPNAGHPEAVYAGALGLRLGGPTRYAEGVIDKPWIHPTGTDARPTDIERAVGLMWLQTLASSVAFTGLVWLVWLTV